MAEHVDTSATSTASYAYGAVGNVADVWTTLPTGTDYQALCYDEQNRLVWASSASGTVPCGSGGGGTWSAGSLSSATYTHPYTYDTLNRLTSGPLGNYGYGDSAHLDAVTAIGVAQAQCPSWGCTSTYSASYDAAGDMTCRAPTSATMCGGLRITGAQLTYDNERRLASWQNAPSSPTSSTSNLYDGEGNRVEQTVTNGAATTTVMYIGELEELSTTAGVTTTTTSYYAGSQRIAQATNGAFSYLGSDNLGSAQVALDGSGNAQASVLYDPYGNTRYSSGTMPGSYRFTGQRADAATGLDYYHARYYDAVSGQFTSADTVQDGLNHYAYVGGDPETATDPTGHMRDCQQFDDCSTTPPPPPPSSGGCQSENCGTSAAPPAPPPLPSGGCTSNCGGKGPSGGSPCGGCKIKSGDNSTSSGADPLQLEHLRSSALHAISEFQDILDKLDGLHQWLDRLLSILPALSGVAQAVLDNIWNAFNALDLEFHTIQSWYRGQESWQSSDWTTAHVVGFALLIHLFMIGVTVTAIALSSALEALPGALAEDPPLAGVVAALVEPSATIWELTVVGLNAYADTIVQGTMNRQVEILSGSLAA